ncbi:intramolecular oxidoreductase [Fragilaria crotonensis]|nr:intramolecular oxidoreductase [Fragilaria crotonensis]
MVTRLVILLLCSSPLVLSSAVIQLDESNFERLTRASSGQTNGKWFVMFTTSKVSRDPVLQDLASIVSDGIHVGIVNVLENRKLSQRLGIRFYPTHLYFVKNRMCTYRGPISGDGAVQAMLSFVETRYQSIVGSVVPPPPKFWDDWMEFVHKVWRNSSRFVSVVLEDMDHIAKYRKNAAVALMLIGGVVGALFVVLLRIVFPGKKATSTKLEKVD